MRTILRQRPLRLIFTANLVSMLGSGMNSAAVTWFILQATHSETALGVLMVVATIPALLTLPCTGVIIDREDRRRLVMLLDASRGIIILAVAIMAFRGRVQLWHLYFMNTLVAAGFWMFWPTITALIQELTPESQFVQSNTFLLAGVQGGWLMAGALVGFVYNRIGLGGVLLIDFSTYLVSFLCYLGVRKGRHVVKPVTSELAAEIRAAETAFARFWRELREGMSFLRGNSYVVLVGVSWALFIGAMLAQGVVTAPMSDRILHAGAVGYGWLNAGWGVGAFVSTLYAAAMIRALGARRAVAFSMALLSLCLFALPYSPVLAIAVGVYGIMGSARGVGGVSISSSLMEIVPKHFMGRVQNTFYFAGTMLQLLLSFGVGAVAHRVGLAAAFAIIALVYFVAAVTAAWPAQPMRAVAASAESTSGS